MEKRRQAAEESRAHRQRVADDSTVQENEDTSVLDNLLEKLRNGDNVGRKTRRTRPGIVSRVNAPLALNTEALLRPGTGTGDDTVDIAKDMLARLKMDGFDALPPASPTSSSASRMSRRRQGSASTRSSARQWIDDGTLTETSVSQDQDALMADDSTVDGLDTIGSEAEVDGTETEA